MTGHTFHRLLHSTSAFALLGAGVLTIAAASSASANCTVNGTNASSDLVDAVPSGGAVVCDTGRRLQGFDGRPGIPVQKNDVPANGFDARIKRGAKLVAPGTGLNDGSNVAALFFGPGSSVTIEAGGEVLGPGSGPGLIVFTGPGGRLVNDGFLSVDGSRPVVQGALNSAVPATGLTLVNRGDIESVDLSPTPDTSSVPPSLPTTSAVNTAAGTTILNDGKIQRRSPSGGAVSMRDNSTLTNNGAITFAFSPYPSSVPADAGSRQFAVQATGAGSEIVNTGIISIGGGRGDAITVARGDGTTITNRAKGAIIATNAENAIVAGGDDILITNHGVIEGGSESAVTFFGENGRLRMLEGSNLAGDVNATAMGEALKTIRELGLDPNNPREVEAYDRRCGGTNPASVCIKRVLEFPALATVEYETGSALSIDPGATRFTGINRFVLSGTGPLTLSQDFAAGDQLDPNAASQSLTGNFGDTLEFEVADPDAVINMSGVIGDNPNDPDQFRGTLRKTGDGTLILTGRNTYSGDTTITGGTLQLGDGGRSGSIRGDVTNNGALRFNRGDVHTFAGAISGSGRVEQAGTGVTILNGRNTHTGGTVISAGTLQLGFTGSIVGDVVNDGLLVFNQQTSKAFDGDISGSGAVRKINPTTLTLTGDSTYTGGTEVRAGTLAVEGSLTSDIVAGQGSASARGARVGGSGSTTGSLTVRPGSAVAPGSKGVGTFSVGDFDLLAGAKMEIDAVEAAGGGLSADRLNVSGTATFGESSVGAGKPYGPTLIDVTFEADTKVPALEGITIVSADGGLVGTAPGIVLDPASLPNGQNFHLNLEATNLGGTFAGPGEAIPDGAGGEGFVVLQVSNSDPDYVTPPQITVINAPHLVPGGQPVLAPTQVPYLLPTATPTATPVLAPALIKGPTSNVTTPVVMNTANGTPAKTGIRVKRHGVRLGGGTLTPQPQTTTGTPANPNTIPVGTVNTVVIVEPPTDLGITDFVSISGSYGKVSQTHAQTGTKFALLYTPHQVQVAKIPTDFGGLTALGVSQTGTQRTVGQALTSLLPQPHARPETTDQANLVAGLYPLGLDQINDALDSVAGGNEDPTFVTVLNTREFQDSLNNRLRYRRDDGADTSEGITRHANLPASDRQAWGGFFGGYADGDYLDGSEIRTWGLVLGADRTVAKNTVAGVAVSYTDAGTRY